MDKNDKPTISKDSTIYCMANYRNYRLLFTAMMVLVCGMYLAYGAISSPGTQSLYNLTLDLLVLEIAAICFYLYYKRSKDSYNHPDVQRFLSFGDPRRTMDLFESEVNDPDTKRFKNGRITRSFIVTESLFHFPWTFYSEVIGAYARQTIWAMIRMPFFSPYKVVILLSDGKKMQFNCDCKKEAENLRKIVSVSASVSEGSGDRNVLDVVRRGINTVVKKVDDRMNPTEYPDNDLEEISILVGAGPAKAGNSSSRPVKTGKSPVLPAAKGPDRAVTQPVPASPREKKKGESPREQISRLYRSLEAGNVKTSTEIIDAMGDAANMDAADILIILLEDPAESIRAHTALALGKLRQKTAVEPLIALLDDRSAPVRENAAIALGMIGDNRAEIPLQKVPIDNPRVKRAAVHALTRIEGKKMRTL